MSKYGRANGLQQNKIIRKFEVQIRTLNKAVAALPPLCDCETKYSLEEERALAVELAALCTRGFQQELDTGVRASVDHMDPSKKKANKRLEHHLHTTHT